MKPRPCRSKCLQLESRRPHRSGNPSLRAEQGKGPGEPGRRSRRSSAEGTQHHNSGVNASSGASTSALVNRATGDMAVLMSLEIPTAILSDTHSSDGVAGSHANSTANILRKLHAGFRRGCTISHPHQLFQLASLPTHVLCFLMIAILAGIILISST